MLAFAAVDRLLEGPSPVDVCDVSLRGPDEDPRTAVGTEDAVEDISIVSSHKGFDLYMAQEVRDRTTRS